MIRFMCPWSPFNGQEIGRGCGGFHGHARELLTWTKKIMLTQNYILSVCIINTCSFYRSKYHWLVGSFYQLKKNGLLDLWLELDDAQIVSKYLGYLIEGFTSIPWLANFQVSMSCQRVINKKRLWENVVFGFESPLFVSFSCLNHSSCSFSTSLVL